MADLMWSHRADVLAALARGANLDDGHDVETSPLYGGDLESTLRQAGPAVLDLGAAGCLGILETRKGKAVVLTPDLSVRALPLEKLVDRVYAAAQPASITGVDRLLDSCSVRGARRARARRTIVCQHLRKTRIGSLHTLSRHPGSSFPRQLREAGLWLAALSFITAHGLETLLWLAVWWMAGQAALSGRIDSGRMEGWALLLAALVPARVWATWAQGKFSVGASGLLKQRLLTGALRLEAGQVAHEGAGKFFSRVTEAEALETLALSGGLMSAVALLELAAAAAVISIAAPGGLLLVLLALWIAVTAGTIWGYVRARFRWTEARMVLTHDAVEQMTGHRTRLAQESPEDRHTTEDEALERYHRISARMDRWGVAVTAVAPNGWLVAGLAGLLPAFLGDANTSNLAAGLGGVLLAHQALRHVSAGATQLAGAAVSWRSVAPLFRAARAALSGTTSRQETVAPPAKTVLDAADLSFRFRDRARPVLEGVNLRIERGDWVLLEGASGGGKSTLVSLLTGLRQPSDGLLTSGGLDRAALGEEAWRKRFAAAPQYHENHIFTGTLAFNLLLGRAWPPSAEDLAEGHAVCHELGLGPLLDRMPGGLHQVVGDTGWQLSQGERSRVFLARALLQHSEMIVLDESFAALDPQTLRRSMECVLSRAKTLLVVAHP
jgi:ATP-binding cassette subfamily B protein